MSDSDESGVTHTEISSPFEDLSDIGSPGVVGPEHEGLPWMLDDPYVQVALQAPPSPDYIPGPEEPQSPPLPDFVPEPVYPEYMPQEDEVFPAEEQPLPAAASPTTQSPDYVPESDPEADPEEDDDEDPEEDPVDYPADGGDDGDDEDESSEDDDEVDIAADDDEEEEEHPAPADSAVVALPAADQAPSTKEIEPFTPVPTPVWSDAEVARLLAISTPPSSLLSPWSINHHRLPRYPFSTTTPDNISITTELSPPLPYHHQENRPEVTLTASKEGRLWFVANQKGDQADFYLERDVGYRITDSWDEIVEAMQGTPVVTNVVELSQRMTEFDTRVMRDTDEVYTRLDDEQSKRPLMAGWLNMLFKDRRVHACTARPIENEARMSREAWGRFMDTSDLARANVMSLRTTMLAQQSQIRELQSADRRRQTVIIEMLAADHRRQK
ncbi:hypothetical protein Tco_0552910 [Tanacetum coccineum]